MATVTRPTTWDREATQRKVRHPLRRLRGYIRLYVGVEGLAVLGIYLALWFWIGLLLDYGFFKAFGVDWVQELPFGVRAGVLGLLLAGLLAVVAAKVLLRLVREFSHPALALVLERRFPELLGDRLITAVEMADPRLAERYGHSQAMIDETVRDAAERVDRAPVREVFNRRRLWQYVGVVAALTAGLYVLAGAGYCAARGRPAAGDYVANFRNVAAIWFERNVLLEDTLWPRRAYLELLDFPGEELKIGRGSAPPTLRVRAYKWVVADRDRRRAPEGWRAATWDDLPALLNTDVPPRMPSVWHLITRPEWAGLLGVAPGSGAVSGLPWPSVGLLGRPERPLTLDEAEAQLDRVRFRRAPDGGPGPARWVILGRPGPAPDAEDGAAPAPPQWRALAWDDLEGAWLGVPVPALPGDWAARPGQSVPVDEVEKKVELPEVRGRLSGDLLLGVRAVLDQLNLLDSLHHEVFAELDRMADSPAMSRRFRKLVIPHDVRVVLKGAASQSEQTMQAREDNEFTVTLPELKESVRFTVRGEDYTTPPRKITVVPPPDLVEMTLDEDQPAYLYHRPPRGGTGADLKGLRQIFRGLPVSLTGERSSVDLPAGTDVVLTARTDKPLRERDGVRAVPAQGAEPVDVPLEQVDATTFRTRFRNLTRPVDVVFEFTDADGVGGQRHVVLKPVPDLPPEVDVQVEVLRKTNQGYLCTPWALVPFSGKVRDDRGLSDVEYAYVLSRAEESPKANPSAVLQGSWIPLGPRAVGPNVGLLVRTDRGESAEDERQPEKRVRLGTFDDLLRSRAAEEVPLVPFLRDRLAEPPPPVPELSRLLLREFNLDPEAEAGAFDVAALGLEVTDPGRPQPHYKLRLRVAATDNNYETGPRQSARKETFTLLVVSEEELLAEIGRDEEGLRVKMTDAVEGLKDARTKLEAVVRELPELKPNEFSPMATRVGDLDEALGKGLTVSHEVQQEYRRILKELIANQGRQKEQRNGLVAKMITKVDDKIIKPLDIAIDPEFPAADKAMLEFQQRLRDRQKDAQAAGQAMESLSRVIDRLTGVLDAMADIQGINELIKKLVQIREAEDAEYKRLLQLKKKIIESNLGEPDK